MGPSTEKDHNMTKKGQKGPKTPWKGPKNGVFQNPTPNSESSDFFDVRNGLVFEFRSKFGKIIFFALKNMFCPF